MFILLEEIPFLSIQRIGIDPLDSNMCCGNGIQENLGDHVLVHCVFSLVKVSYRDTFCDLKQSLCQSDIQFPCL